MKQPWIGVGRVVLTGALAAILLYAGQAVGSEVSLTRWDTPVPPSGGTTGSAPTNEALVCPGPELLGLKGAPDQAQAVSVTGGRAPTQALEAAPSTQGTLTLTKGSEVTKGSGLMGSIAVSTPDSVVVTGTGGLAPGLAASQQWTSDTKELRGLVTTACPAGGDDLWLVAGGGAAGRQERLILANTGANEVSVDVTVLGVKGVITAPNSRGIVVPGRGRTTVLLDAIAAGEAAPAVHVTVRGGAVSAILSDVWLDGSIAAGADASTPITPGVRQVIPGVDLAQAGVLRVAVPGPTQAVVSARVLTPEGAAPLPGGGVARVAAGSTLDLPLADLPKGTYAVEAQADVPIVAAALSQARDGSGPGDFAWSTAAPVIGGLAGVPLPALPADGTRSLVLTASQAEVRVEVWTGDPAAPQHHELTVAVDRMAAVSVPSGAGGVWVRRSGGSGEVRAALLNTTGTGPTRLLSVMTLEDTTTTSTKQGTVPLP